MSNKLEVSVESAFEAGFNAGQTAMLKHVQDILNISQDLTVLSSYLKVISKDGPNSELKRHLEMLAGSESGKE